MTKAKTTRHGLISFLAFLSIFLLLGSCSEKSVNVSSDPGMEWEIRAQGVTNNLVDVIWTGEMYIALGEHEIVSSPDGRNWTLRYTYNAGVLQGLFFGEDIYWAVGVNVVLRSEDGLAWSSAQISADLRDVAVSGNLVVAVGDTGDVWVTDDGIIWTESYVSMGCRAISRNLAGDNLDGMFRFATGGSDFFSKGSFDGTLWGAYGWGGFVTYPLASLTTSYGGVDINDLILREDVVWAVGDAGMMSIRGRVYSSGEVTSNSLNGLAWGGETAVAVGDAGTIVVATVDTMHFLWTSVASQNSPTNMPLRAVCFNGLGYLAVGQSGIVISSPPLKK